MSYRNSLEAKDKFVAPNPLPLLLFAVVLLSILALRLFSLQVLQYNDLLTESELRRFQPEVIEAPRGFIFDRNGQILAENQMSYSITIDPFERSFIETSVPRLASLVPNLPELLGVKADEMVDKVKDLSRRSSNPEKIISDADFHLLSIVEEYSNELPGFGATFDQLRSYPFGPMAAHIIGYMGELNRDEYGRLKGEGYGYGHSIGRLGIEKYYEGELKGENGFRYIERNYLSRRLGMTQEIEPLAPIPGRNVTLTLDSRLQMSAEEAFGDSILGSLVALDPRNGDVLVMASMPSFDPNEFIHSMTHERLFALQSDSKHPMYNRAIQAAYPPGSPFKVLTAIVGLENGIDPDTKFKSCHGVYFYGRPYKCWKEGGHGSLDMLGAITQSCNVYFYQLGRKLTIEKWQRYGDMFGFGKRTGIDISGENPGLYPTLDYYEKHKVDYSPGMMLNLSIGQGEILVTMLQLAHYAGVVGTAGLDAKPHLVLTGREEPKRVPDIAAETFEIVRQGMHGVVHSPRGTAKSARIKGHLIAGKTGTAQNPHGADHKLFMVFAPYENPTIAIACVAENAGDYQFSMAVRIVKQVLTDYFTYYPDNTVAVNDPGTL